MTKVSVTIIIIIIRVLEICHNYMYLHLKNVRLHLVLNLVFLMFNIISRILLSVGNCPNNSTPITYLIFISQYEQP